MPYHIKRWQGLYSPSSLSSWNSAIQKLKDFSTQRPEYCYKHLLEKFGWTTNDLIDFKLAITNANIGSVRINNLPMSTNIYAGKIFKNYTFQIQARPAKGYRFLGWKGIEGNNYDETISLTESSQIIPIFELITPPELKFNIDGLSTKLKWKSYTNDLYSTEQTENLSSGFGIIEQGINATPPENFSSITNESSRNFYRLKIESPPEW